jgi:hypothetical protein
MSVLGDIRSGLRDNIKANLDGWQVSPYRIASPTPPGIMIVRGEIRPHRAMQQGLVEYDLRVLAFVADAGDARITQVHLDALLDPSGPGSMMAAIESDKTLGGVADDLVVQTIPEEQILVGADNMGRVIAEWPVMVYVGST